MFVLNIIFYLLLLMGTLIMVSSSSWFSMWLGLEVNMMAFIPLMYSSNKMSTEAIIKYFFVQALSSIFILSSSLLLFLKVNINLPFPMLSNMMKMIFSMALLTKLASAPFHFWFPSVSEALKWSTLSLLITWQKVGPLVLLSLLYSNILIGMASLMSAILGAFGGINQTSIKKILAFSSITHLGWMILLVILSKTLLLSYFLVYSFLSLSIILICYKMKKNFLSQFMLLNKLSMLMFSFILILLSLGGLPPFLGFLPKWMSLKMIFNLKMMISGLTLVTMSILSLYYYLRVSYSFLFMSAYSNKIFIKKQDNILILINITFSSLILPLVSFLY